MLLTPIVYLFTLAKMNPALAAVLYFGAALLVDAALAARRAPRAVEAPRVEAAQVFIPPAPAPRRIVVEAPRWLLRAKVSDLNAFRTWLGRIPASPRYHRGVAGLRVGGAL